jgi:hypothetical protein
VQSWGAGGYDNAVKPQFFDVVLYQFLAWVGTNEFIIAGYSYRWQTFSELGYFLDINRTSDVGTTVADIDTYFRLHFGPPY